MDTFFSIENVIAACMAIVAMGGWAASHFLSSRRRRRHTEWLRALPRTRVLDAGNGRVKLVGRVRLVVDPLVAPITGRRGACYEAIVFESEPDEVTKKIISETRCSDFLLDDGSGVARVHAQGATLELVHDAQRSSGVWPPPAELESFLRRYGERGRGTFLSRSLEYSEAVLEEGEEVVVYGVGQWHADTNQHRPIGYRDPAAQFVVAAAEGIDLFITDDPAIAGIPNRSS
jgi:hypothetical protein